MRKLFGPLFGRLLLGIEKTTQSARLGLLKAHGATIGNDVFFGGQVNDYKDSPFLTIEDGATVSIGTMIVLHDSALNNILGLPIKFGKVMIGEESYIGANCTIMCGVRIGKRAIVGAHSVVTHDIPDEAVAVGVPARIVGTIHDLAEKQELQSQEPSDRFYYFDVIEWRNRDHSEFLSAHRDFIAEATGYRNGSSGSATQGVYKAN